jgi:uncharacterized membrane protein (DUF4010 family)
LDPTLFKQLAIALGLGLLVGLQRERSASLPIAGFRTFPLITLLGTISALVARDFGGWIIAASALALGGLIVVGTILTSREKPADFGLTTEVAMLLMFAVGAYLVAGRMEVAVVVGGGVAVLLHFKGQLHGFAARLGDDDLKAIMQFALISLVILPVLPDRTYGPYSVLNPRQIWLMVVLIVGISVAGYIVYKFFGERVGVITGGFLGGLVSSTATTVSYARRSKEDADGVRLIAVVIMISSTVVFVRVLLEIAVVARSFFVVALIPIASILLLFVILSAAVWKWGYKEETGLPPQKNPSELKPALLFGLIYALILVAVAAANQHFGNRGLYVVAAISGLTDVDAITLSTAQLVEAGRIDSADGWKLVLIALLSNLMFKGVTIAAIGSRQLLARIGLLYGIGIAAGVALILLWR